MPAIKEIQWSDFKIFFLDKILVYTWSLGSRGEYEIHAEDDNILYKCFIYTDTVPYPDISQTQNDLDKTDFESKYKDFYSQFQSTSNTAIKYRYTTFKQIVTYKNLNPQYIEYPESYLLFAIDGVITYQCIVYKTTFNIAGYSSNSQIQDLNTFILDKPLIFNRNIVSMTTAGVMRVAHEKPTDTKRTYVSHNFCDKTTWYTMSVGVTGEVAIDSGDHTTYSLAHEYIIDVSHGKITREDLLVIQGTASSTYSSSVYVNGVKKTEINPGTGSGDFTIDYVLGKIIFASALSGSDVVTCSYYYATTNTFKIYTKDLPFNIGVNAVQIHITEDVVLNDTMCYQAFGLVDIVAPQAVAYGIVPSGTMVPINQITKYKRMSDFINDSQSSYSTYPAVGGAGWRGLNTQTIVFGIDYVSTVVIPSLYQSELRIWTENSSIIPGTLANTTFFCQEITKTSGVVG